MRKLSTILSAAILLLTACSKEEPQTPQPETGETGYTVVNLRFGQPTTYATVGALPEEKVVKSVAIFVNTSAGFHKYLSTAGELHTPLNEVSAGYYTAAVKVESETTQNAQMFVLANYNDAQYDLAAQLASVTSWEDLKGLKTTALADASAGPTTPLLMYSNTTVSLSGGKVLDKDITLKRLVARFDVIDNVNDPAKLELVSASLLNPKAQGYLHPDQSIDNVLALPQIARFADKTVSNGVIRGLYAYETAGTEAQPLTVCVVCRINGVETVKLITIRQKGNTPAYAPIRRNSYHGINLYWDTDNNTLSPVIIDDGWDDDGGDLG